MTTVPRRPVTMHGRLALPLLTGLRKRGIDVDAIASRLGIDEESLRPLNARITMEQFLDLHSAVVAATGDRAAPIEMAADLDRDAFPLAFHLLGTQATLRDGFRFVEPYRQTIVDRIEYALVEHGELAHIRFDLDGAPLGPPPFAEYLAVLVLALGQMLIPGRTPPTEIVFAHRWPRHSERLAELCGCPVRFGGTEVAYVFPNPRLNTPIKGADPHLGEALAKSAASLLDVDPNERVRDRARRYLAHATLSEGEPTATEVASALRMSARTLRRRLESDGTSLRALLDEVRHERALALLEQGRVSLDEMAYQLGFSNASSFRRAFKRWTGRLPSDFGAPTG